MSKYLAFLFLTPYLIGFMPFDSAYTHSEFGAGTGRYTYHDCNGSEKRQYYDGGIAITHKYNGPFRVGLAGGFIASKKIGLPYLYPDLSVDFDYLSLGTTGLRVGNKDLYYAQIGILNGAPVFSGKGMINAGIGVKTNTICSNLWVGANIYPYNSPGIVIQPEFPLNGNRFIFVTTRYGTYENQPEWGLSLGLRFK